MRGFTPRWQSTILPVTLAGSSVLGKQRAASAVAAPAAAELAASTIAAPTGRAAVTDAPLIVPTPPEIVAVAAKVRASFSAATVVTQGAAAGVPIVPAAGPSLPAEVATNTPASEAPRKATSTGSMRSAV